MPSKSSWSICKIDKIEISSEFKYSMKYNQFSAKIDVRYQTLLIEDQAPSFVGPDLDPYCLQKSFKINIPILDIVRKCFILFKNF